MSKSPTPPAPTTSISPASGLRTPGGFEPMKDPKTGTIHGEIIEFTIYF
jgi:hypothetical protein